MNQIFHSNQSKGLIPLFFLYAVSERLSVVVVVVVVVRCVSEAVYCSGWLG